MTGPVLHDDEPDAEATGPDGAPLRNLTADQYAATYATGEPHHLPAELLATLPAETDQ